MQAQYFWPLDNRQHGEFEKLWNEVTQQCGKWITSEIIPVMFGR